MKSNNMYDNIISNRYGFSVLVYNDDITKSGFTYIKAYGVCKRKFKKLLKKKLLVKTPYTITVGVVGGNYNKKSSYYINMMMVSHAEIKKYENTVMIYNASFRLTKRNFSGQFKFSDTCELEEHGFFALYPTEKEAIKSKLKN